MKCPRKCVAKRWFYSWLYEAACIGEVDLLPTSFKEEASFYLNCDGNAGSNILVGRKSPTDSRGAGA
jgi:hypothetical protein